jgi:hypothetical protein
LGSTLERRAARLPFLQPPPGRLACLLVEVLQNTHVHYFDNNVTFFGSARFIRLASAAVTFFYFAHPISRPKRNVNNMSPLGLSSTLTPPRCAFMISITMASSSLLYKNCCLSAS